MPIDNDIPEILELEGDEKLVHTLHRTYLSFAFTVIGAAIFISVMVIVYSAQFVFDPDLIWLVLPIIAPIYIILPIIIIVIGLILGKWYAAGHLFLITTKRILFYTKFVNKVIFWEKMCRL